MKEFKKINSSDIKIGMRFSAPVFFDDGENMFLAEDKSAKSYHIAAIQRWNIPYLLTYGHVISDSIIDRNSNDYVYDLEEVEELEEI